MSFAWEGNTPEGRLARKQSRDRQDFNSLEAAARSYSHQAQEILSGGDGPAARDEVARFAKDISSKQGPEQYDVLNKLVNALNIRKRSIFGDIPEEEHERVAFALALVQAYQKSLQ